MTHQQLWKIFQAVNLTILKDFADAGPLVLAASVSLHVWKHSALMSPKVVPGAKEEDRELSDLMPKVLDVCGDVSGMMDLCRPPSEEGEREVELFRVPKQSEIPSRFYDAAAAASLTCTFPV